MSRSTVLWERVLAKHRELEVALSDDSEVEPCDEEPTTEDDPFADFNSEFGDEDSEPTASDEQNDGLSEPGTPVPVVEMTFKEAANLWLSQSRRELEHALQSIEVTTGEVFPTKRPLLVFGSHRTGLTEPEYHRVKVEREGWPHRLYSTERLTSTAAAKMLASSETGTDESSDPTCFEGETVAVEVPNPLLADDRWIAIWPELKLLPELKKKSHQWERVRRVVWCVNRDQIGPQDVLNWLSRFWQDIPVRVVLFRAASFVRGEQDGLAQSKALPRVRRTLEKFNSVKGHPWIVVGP